MLLFNLFVCRPYSTFCMPTFAIQVKSLIQWFCLDILALGMQVIKFKEIYNIRHQRHFLCIH